MNGDAAFLPHCSSTLSLRRTPESIDAASRPVLSPPKGRDDRIPLIRAKSTPMTTFIRSLFAAAASCACAATFAQAASDNQPSVTPYRPSVSTPAALSAPGWLEIEAGGLHVHEGGGARRDSIPYTLKLAFSEDWGVRFGGDAWVGQTDETGQRMHGGGDSSVVLKRRFAVNDASAFGIEAGATIPTGKTGIGSGKSDYSLVGIYSADIGSLHTDLNLASTRVGAVDPGTGRMQTLWAASLSKSFGEQWGGVVELSGTHQRGVDGASQFLMAASYNVSKAMTLDAGFARSLRSGAPSWSAFTGITLLGPRVF